MKHDVAVSNQLSANENVAESAARRIVIASPQGVAIPSFEIATASPRDDNKNAVPSRLKAYA